jgi:hypothetical protein
MPKFAVYYVPEETNELYRLGSSVVGYDIRKCEPVHTLEALRCIPHFTDQWVTKAKPYGFHLTIGDSIDFNVGEIARIEKEIIDLLGCFNPEHDFALHRRRDDFVTFWGPQWFCGMTQTTISRSFMRSLLQGFTLLEPVRATYKDILRIPKRKQSSRIGYTEY